MARLPEPGGDVGKWAQILNNFLLVSHNPDGTVRESAVKALAAATISLSDLKTSNSPGEVIKNLKLSNDGTNLVWRKDTIINVRAYGATGDGITDDTDAIQTAINSAPNGGTITFPRGTYMTRGLKINANGIQLTGMRWGVRIVRLSGTQPLIDISGANPGLQVRDIAGNIVVAVRPSPTAPGTIATLTFSRPYAATPLTIMLTDNSSISANLYISARSTTSFTVSTRNALAGGSLLNFDYVVIA